MAVVDRLHVRVAGLDGALFKAQDQPQRLPRRAGGVLLRRHQIEQPQPEIDGRHPRPDRPFPDPCQHRRRPQFEDEGRARQLADQHHAPRRPGGAAAIRLGHEQLVGKAHGTGEPLHETRITLQPFARRRTVRRGGCHRVGANRGRQPLPLAGIGAVPRGPRCKRERTLFPKRGVQRHLDRRIVHLRAERHRQARPASGTEALGGPAIRCIRIHGFPVGMRRIRRIKGSEDQDGVSSWDSTSRS